MSGELFDARGIASLKLSCVINSCLEDRVFVCPSYMQTILAPYLQSPHTPLQYRANTDRRLLISVLLKQRPENVC